MSIEIIAIILLILAVIVLFIFHPYSQFFGKNYYKGNDKSNMVALTFDDGSSLYTEKILDILNQNNVTATFFVIGKNVEENPEIIRRINEQGNEIGIHSYSHSIMLFRNYDFVYSELAKTKNLIINITGKEPRLFRPPYSLKTFIIFSACTNLNLKVVSWNVFPRDYLNPGAEEIVKRVVSGTKAGSIIVLHDGGGNRNQTAGALPEIIKQLKKKGYEFVTVSELLS